MIAYNNKFFNNHSGDAVYKSGTLAKIAIMSGYYNYEDSGMITTKLSKDMSTNITRKKDVVLGPNSNIEFIVKKGDIVEVGDPLLVMDESFDDDSINKLLAHMSDGVKDKLLNTSKIPVKSSYSGVIEDIKVYYTIDKDQMSPSLRKTIDSINKIIKDKKKLISEYINDKDATVLLDPTDKVEAKYGKVKGVDVGEGVLIEFYINTELPMGTGDKFVFDCALKSVICKIIDEGKEPYSEYRKDEEISAFLSPISELARMTKSIEQNMFGNKVMIELKRHVEEIFNE